MKLERINATKGFCAKRSQRIPELNRNKDDRDKGDALFTPTYRYFPRKSYLGEVAQPAEPIFLT